MPKVTLLGAEGCRYDLVIGVKTYVFNSGRPKAVPVAVALEAKKRTNAKGSPLFAVEDMPTIVEKQAETAPESAVDQNGPDQSGPVQDAPDQNSAALHLNERQRVFEQWPLEFT